MIENILLLSRNDRKNIQQINLGKVSSCYVMSWASPAEEWGDFGGSGLDPPPLKMSVIAYFWQSWPCWLIWNRFQVVTLWAELARFYGTLIKGLSGAPHQKKCLLTDIFSTPYHAGYIAICSYLLLFELS